MLPEHVVLKQLVRNALLVNIIQCNSSSYAGKLIFVSCLIVFSDEPEPHKKSQTSLNSEEKPLDSETDSLGEYEDPDPSKFNEDGSFIGQYGGRKKSSERIDQDGTTPSALSTFV